MLFYIQTSLNMLYSISTIAPLDCFHTSTLLCQSCQSVEPLLTHQAAFAKSIPDDTFHSLVWVVFVRYSRVTVFVFYVFCLTINACHLSRCFLALGEKCISTFWSLAETPRCLKSHLSANVGKLSTKARSIFFCQFLVHNWSNIGGVAAR